MRCKHCYHADKGYDNIKLNHDSIYKILELAANEFSHVKIIWHGGEPLLMGVPFYLRCVQIEREINKKYGTHFINSIQTNASLIDKSYINFFKNNNFYVGISFDGPYNSVLRTHSEEVERAITLMQDNKLKFSCICVLCDDNINKYIELYQWFNQKGISLSFNPIFESGEAKNHTDFLINPKKYADAFYDAFLYWLYDKECKIHVRSFYRYIGSYLNLQNKLCCDSSCLYNHLCLDASDDIYTCGRSNVVLNNLNSINSVKEIFDSEPYKHIVNTMVVHRNECLQKCPYVSYCHGGCAVNYINAQNKGLSWDCVTQKLIFEKIGNELSNLSSNIVSNNANEYNQMIIKRVMLHNNHSDN